MGEFRVTAPRDTSGMGGIYGVDPVLAPPRNPARAPQVVEDIASGMVVQPAYDIGMGVGSMVGGQGWNNPEAMAGLTAAIGLLTPMKAGALGPKAGIRAYHGSPYDFDKFDLSKIGTGEGAQSYGHGLYFAENPKTAQSYKDALAPRGIVDQGEHLASLYLQKAPDRAAAIASLERDFATARSSPRDYQPLDVHQRALDLLRSDYKPNQGKMYEVNINAKPEQFLDWSKSLAEQSAPVHQAFGKLRNAIKQENPYAQSGLMLEDARTNNIPFEDFNRQFEKYDFDPISAAEMMSKSGIPGSRYLDQGSRLTGSNNVERLVESHGSREKAMEFAQSQLGKFAPDRPTHNYWTDIAQELKDYKPRTSNYVLFDDKIVDILRKYGLMGPVAAGTLAGADNKQ